MLLFVVGLFGVWSIAKNENFVIQPVKEANLSNETKIRDIIKNYEFWMFFIIVFIGTGTSNMIIVNLGTIVSSLHGNSTEVEGYVTYLSTCNCLGRLLFGYLSDYFKSVPKISFLGLAVLLAGGAQVK